MPFRVSGKNLDIGEALRTRVNARVAYAMTKYFDGGYSGHVTVGKEGFGFRTECAVHLDSGITLHTDGMAADAYASADQAALRTEAAAKELDALSYVIAAPDHETEEEVAAFSPVIIAESTTMLERLSVSEAVLELDMTGAPVVGVRHCVHGRGNI